jgi:uncharacterized protein YndB with AHSA1/START domain
MAEVDGSRTFDTSADELWAVVSDPDRFSQWVPTMRRAESAGRDEVHLEGESHGHRYSLDSSLQADAEDRRLQWGADNDDGYRGWLRVTAEPPGSRVHIHIAIPDSHLGDAPGTAAELENGMEETLDHLAALISA